MRSRYVRYMMGALALALSAGLVQAAEVKLVHKGLTLNADLELASGKKLAQGVVLVVHGALAHRDMESLVYLRGLIKERGYNTLSINLALGVNDRHGMYDCQATHRHRHDDAIGEIDAWLGWLEKQGVKRVTLLGHSRGGGQVALHAAERNSALTVAVALLAPLARDGNDAAGYQRRYRKPLAPLLARAEKLVREGKGDTVLKHTDLLYCPDTTVTAESFVSYYAAGPRQDTPSLIPMIRKPTLVVVAGNDDITIDLGKKMAPLVDGKRVQMKVVDGSDHFFRDLYADEAADAVDAFLKSVGF